MQSITFISTVHKQIGKCSADELCEILEKITPEVVFLEALEDTYSKYQQHTFSNYGVFHEKLEIRALQKYSRIHQFEYVPVLGKGLPNSFEEKSNLVCQNIHFQKMIDNFNSQARMQGFDFLNSEVSIKLNEEMRIYENSILMDNELIQTFNNDIDKYENSMLSNIYSFCMNTKFSNAVFMCGVAHRQSIIDKIETYKSKTNLDFNWEIYGH
ncbi:hypothetical protein [Draconibacterium mangrovi]|uniref:hypothetical protein n=1 Tax=Draconibacterium mangrovi TaxID=2697469 RepID=UPI0013D6AE13|nr:hypothetical protein [Draconibacterium mangrovi]